jgi:arylsulfatase A-like enzyme
VATVVRALKDSGLYEDTIIVFSSDNGGFYWGGGYNYPFRGGKMMSYEVRPGS